jgi:tryptophan-rich sensory protein
MNKINWKILIVCFLIVILVSGIGNLFISRVVDGTWYKEIRPEISPPNWVFSAVWSILSFLIALSMYYSWIECKNEEQREDVALAFSVNLSLNLLWTIFFFGARNPFVAFLDLIALIISTLVLINFIWKIDRKASYLLMPYLIWILFALVLNGIIVLG